MDPFGSRSTSDAATDDPWSILGLGEDERDERSVKRAFRRLSREIRPADDRERYRRFRAAYETALKMARGEGGPPTDDGHPSAIAAILGRTEPDPPAVPTVPESDASEWSFPVGGAPARSPSPPPFEYSSVTTPVPERPQETLPESGLPGREAAAKRELLDEPVTEAITAPSRPAKPKRKPKPKQIPAAKRTLPKEGLPKRPDRDAEVRRNRDLLPPVIRRTLGKPERRTVRGRRNDKLPRDRIRKVHEPYQEPESMVKLVVGIVAGAFIVGLIILITIAVVSNSRKARRERERMRQEQMREFRHNQDLWLEERKRRMERDIMRELDRRSLGR